MPVERVRWIAIGVACFVINLAGSARAAGPAKVPAPGVWAQVATLGHGYNWTNRFGYATAIDGDNALVGAYDGSNADGLPQDTGFVAAYRRTGSEWSVVPQYIGPADAAQFTGNVLLRAFGSSLAISGDTFVTSANHLKEGSLPEAVLYPFVRTAQGWVQQGPVLTGAAPAAQQTLAAATVALSGNLALLCPSNAYVYERKGSVWTQQAVLRPPSGDYYFASCAISGDTVVVGGSNLARVFVRSGETWVQQGQPLTSPDVTTKLFGSAVAISGDTLAVASTSTLEDPTIVREVTDVFVRQGQTWVRQASLRTNGGLYSRSYLALSGDRLLQAAQSQFAESGHVEAAILFTRSNGVWAQQGTPLSEYVYTGELGVSASLSADSALVGVEEGNPEVGVPVFSQCTDITHCCSSDSDCDDAAYCAENGACTVRAELNQSCGYCRQLGCHRCAQGLSCHDFTCTDQPDTSAEAGAGGLADDGGESGAGGTSVGGSGGAPPTTGAGSAGTPLQNAGGAPANAGSAGTTYHAGGSLGAGPDSDSSACGCRLGRKPGSAVALLSVLALFGLCRRRRITRL